MKKSYGFILSTLLVMSFFSCGNNTDSTQAKVDSLQAALDQRDADYKQLDEYLTVISSSLEDISKQESEIFNPSKESPVPNREQIKEELENFQKTLQEQRERIAKLEQQLRNEKGGNKKLQAIVIALKAQLVEKESQIVDLRNELSDKNVTIADLHNRMGALTRQSAIDQQTIAAQSKMVSDQDATIHRGYYIIGSKAKLEQEGLLSTGFLKKSKVDFSNINKQQFREVDIRNTTEITINSKKPKIRTQMPEDSYVMEEKGDMTVLKIIDTDRFWSISKFLIIQI